MNIQFFSRNEELVKPIKVFFHRKRCDLFDSKTFSELFESAAKNPAHVFVISAGVETEVRTLDFIKDLRMYFGAFPFIFVVGKKGAFTNSTNFLNVGADDVLEAPFDTGILEDLLGHSLKDHLFQPIHYRTVPSGGSPITFIRDISLMQVNRDGIQFRSIDFISRETIFSFDLGSILNIDLPKISFKVVYSEQTEDDDFQYFGEFFEVDPEDKKKIKFELKRK